MKIGTNYFPTLMWSTSCAGALIIGLYWFGLNQRKGVEEEVLSLIEGGSAKRALSKQLRKDGDM